MISGDKFSYDKLSDKTGLPAKEKEEMTLQLAEFVADIVARLDATITQKVESGIEPEKERKGFETKVKEFTATLEGAEKNKTEAEKKRTEAYTAYGTDPSGENLTKINVEHENVNQYSSSIESTTNELKAEKKKLVKKEKELEAPALNLQDEKDTLDYIKNNCLPLLNTVKTEAKDKLEGLISKWFK